MKVELKEFKSLLEEKFGKLTPQANHCADDFYENYEDFISSFKSKRIQIIASPSVLSRKLPDKKYSSYQTYSGLSILLGIVGIIFLFFYWKIAVGMLILSLLLSISARYIKNRTAITFSNQISNKFEFDEFDGIFDVAQYYIAGIIQIRSQTAAAHLPLLPSVSLTGIEKYADIR